MSVMDIEKEEYFTPEQVGEILQLKPESVTKLLRQGKLPGYKVGGSWRINKEELARHMQKSKNAYPSKSDQES